MLVGVALIDVLPAGFNRTRQHGLYFALLFVGTFVGILGFALSMDQWTECPDIYHCRIGLRVLPKISSAGVQFPWKPIHAGICAQSIGSS